MPHFKTWSAIASNVPAPHSFTYKSDQVLIFFLYFDLFIQIYDADINVILQYIMVTCGVQSKDIFFLNLSLLIYQYDYHSIIIIRHTDIVQQIHNFFGTLNQVIST